VGENPQLVEVSYEVLVVGVGIRVGRCLVQLLCNDLGRCVARETASSLYPYAVSVDGRVGYLLVVSVRSKYGVLRNANFTHITKFTRMPGWLQLIPSVRALKGSPTLPARTGLPFHLLIGPGSWLGSATHAQTSRAASILQPAAGSTGTSATSVFTLDFLHTALVCPESSQPHVLQNTQQLLFPICDSTRLTTKVHLARFLPPSFILTRFHKLAVHKLKAVATFGSSHSTNFS
jgi:hypothetical protein